MLVSSVQHIDSDSWLLLSLFLCGSELFDICLHIFRDKTFCCSRLRRPRRGSNKTHTGSGVQDDEYLCYYRDSSAVIAHWTYDFVDFFTVLAVSRQYRRLIFAAGRLMSVVSVVSVVSFSMTRIGYVLHDFLTSRCSAFYVSWQRGTASMELRLHTWVNWFVSPICLVDVPSALLGPIVCWCRPWNCLLSAAGPSRLPDPPSGTACRTTWYQPRLCQPSVSV